MRLLLTTLNSKYIHSCLALKCLYNNIEDIENLDITVKEYTINENLDEIFKDIMENEYDMVSFSTYIWNVEYILRLCSDIKKADKNIKILLGGPEVSYESDKLLQNHKYIDFVIRHEGEVVFRNLIDAIINNKPLEEIDSLTYRISDKIYVNKDRTPEDLSEIKGAYDNFDADTIKDKIVYYETSRGCCYNCSYCLSSVSKKVRFFPFEKVKKDIKKIVDNGAKQIKFVDRTFNYDKNRTIDLIKYLCTLDNGKINFHFEITAHILQDDLLEELKNVREGLFQFEIGVQSTNRNTILAVNRVDNFKQLSEKVRKIKSYKNIHQHLDLIAGLPHEDIKSFKNSFNDVMALRPDNLQLGFLKVLKGSPIKNEVEKYGIKYRNYAPYEVISTDFISYRDIFQLKNVEIMLEDYYNSMTYNYSMEYILNFCNEDYYSFFESFYNFKDENGYQKNLSRDNRFELFCRFAKYYLEEKDFINFREYLRFDYLLMGRNRNIPEFLKNDELFISNDEKKDILNNEKIYEKFNIDRENKRINSLVNIEKFKIDVSNTESINEKNTNIVFNYAGEKNFRNIVDYISI